MDLVDISHDDYNHVLTSQASYPTNKYVRFEELPYTDKGSTIEFENGYNLKEFQLVFFPLKIISKGRPISIRLPSINKKVF